MGSFQWLQKSAALVLLAAWLVLLAVPVAEAFDNGRESPDASHHRIEKVFRTAALSPDVQAARGPVHFSTPPLDLPASFLPASFEGMGKDRSSFSAVGHSSGPPGLPLFKAFSTFRI